MESLTSVCDENLSIPIFNGVSGRSKKAAPIKNKEGTGALGGRKALRDVSNSVHPTPIHSSKGQTSKISIKDTLSSAFVTQDLSKKKNGVSRVTKKAQTGARKALSDISNLDEPRLDEAPKKNANALTGEGFLHNHEGCIKKRDMDVNEFLMTLGLDEDSTANKPAKMKLFSPRTSFEMADLFEDLSSPPPLRQSLKIESPLPSPKFFNHWMLDDQEFVSFKLAETPKMLKP